VFQKERHHERAEGSPSARFIRIWLCTLRANVSARLRPRKCVFCGESIAADEHPHHLEICGLMTLSVELHPHSQCQ